MISQFFIFFGFLLAAVFLVSAFYLRRELTRIRNEFESQTTKLNEFQNDRMRLVQEAAQAQSLATQLSASEKSLVDLRDQLKQADQDRVRAESDAQKYRELLEKERQHFAETERKSVDTFKSLASSALEKNNEQFLIFAKQIFSKYTETAKGDLSQKEQAIESLVKPLRESIDKYQVHLRELESSRQQSYATVEKELKRVIETGQVLTGETRALKDALKKPHVRGRWGEIQLKNCVELAGMSEHADFTTQDATSTEDGIFIPDLTVKMPGGRIVIVDSKAPMDAFVASLEAQTDEKRGAELARHGQQVKDHIRKLSSKSYQDHVFGSADFTVMFLPNESFLYAALESERDLVEFAMQKKILVATPPTFVGLLKVIRYGWNEERLAQNAAEISDAGKELHKRLADFVDSFEKIGYHLGKASEEFSSGRSRLSSRVLVQARRMEALGVKSKKDLPEDLGHDFSEADSTVDLARDSLSSDTGNLFALQSADS